MRHSLFLWLLACEPATVKFDSDTGETDSTVPDSGDSASETGDSADSDSGTDTDSGGDTDTATGAVEGFALSLDPDVVTMVRASWTDAGASEAWVEYRWEDDTWLVAPLVTISSAVLLGIPAETMVEARAALVVGGETRYSETAEISTGRLPSDLLVPTVSTFDALLADPAEYAMISVAVGDYTFAPPFWIEIFDRQGRVVWYKEIDGYLMSFYPTVALDGTHIWYEGDNIFGFASDPTGVTRQTLDGRWSEFLEIPDLGQAAGEGPDGSFFYEQRRGTYGLGQVDADGTRSTVWNCATWMSEHGLSTSDCYMNTVAWSEAHNSVMTSMFYSDTAFEIDLDSGEPIRQMGQLTRGEPYTFSPTTSMFAYQHGVYWTEDNTILASTHVVGKSGVQVAAEYEVDDDTLTLTRVWSYESDDLWATQLGEAVRLESGNTTVGYGQDGAVREVTTDGTVVWQVSWPKDHEGYRVIGHLSLIDDLYALNVGP